MQPLFWIDLEMTGLDEKIHKIIEIAVVITDWNMNKIEEYHQVVFQKQDALDQMDEWCTKTHGDSGLTAQIPNGQPLKKVESDLIALINRHYKKEDRVVIAGNSVGNDKRFIDAQMLELSKKLHYRIVDISSFKEIFKNRYGFELEKKNAHRAVDDIYESINELKAYLSHVSLKPTESES